MKKYIGLFLCLLLTCLCAFALADQIAIDEVNFPDSNFRDVVKTFDKDNNLYLSDDEIADVDWLECNGLNISSLKGIEFFTSLENLDCEDNNLTSLDVSNNILLDQLFCSGNQLTELDVSNLIDLSYFRCSRNNLKKLNINNTPDLSTFYCACNKLTELDVSNNTKLDTLYCYENNLSKLDVSKNTKLTDLFCSDNQLTELDVSHNRALIYLNCLNNPLTGLDVSKNTELVKLICQSDNLTALDVSNNTKLVCLACDFNNISKLDISKNTKLTGLGCRDNPLDELDIRNCPELEELVRTAPFDPRMAGWELPDGGVHQLLFKPGTRIITTTGIIETKIEVSSISLNTTETTLIRTSKEKEPTFNLTAKIRPVDATDCSVEWSSSNTKVAIVDEDGKVTALKKGKAVITCAAKDGSGVKATCTITVKEKQAKKITLSKKVVTLKKGKTFRLKVKTVKPADAFIRKFKWTTSNKKVATVSSKGIIKAKKKGTCWITCTVQGSKIKVRCKVTVE